MVGQDRGLKKWKNPDQRNVKFPAIERLNRSLQNLLSTILSMKILSEPIISQNYCHSGSKPQADGASQIIKCVKMHLLQKKGGAKSQQ